MLYETIHRNSSFETVGLGLILMNLWPVVQGKRGWWGLIFGGILLLLPSWFAHEFKVHVPRESAILITGCSSGIGWALAKEFAQQGYHVYAGVRKESDLQAMNALHRNVQGVILDVTIEDHFVQVKEYIAKQGKPLVGVIGNAGVSPKWQPIELVQLKEIEKTYRVNTFGMILLAKHFMQLLRDAEGRFIIHGSIQGVHINPYVGLYGTTKFSLEGLADVLRREEQLHAAYAGEAPRVAVSIIEAGSIKSGFHERHLMADGVEDACKDVPQGLQASWGFICSRANVILNAGIELAIPIESTFQTFTHALKSPKPRSRYIIGPDSVFASFLGMLPDFVQDAFSRLAFYEIMSRF